MLKEGFSLDVPQKVNLLLIEIKSQKRNATDQTSSHSGFIDHDQRSCVQILDYRFLDFSSHRPLSLEDYLYLKHNNNDVHWTSLLVSRYHSARLKYDKGRMPVTPKDVAVPIENSKGPQVTIYDPNRPQSWGRWFWNTMGY